MEKGSVKFFNESKGFGFIIPDSANDEIFVHSSGVKEKIKQGDKVTYELIEGKKGINAVNVRKQ
jgi:CspA family cold shock protein